MKNIPFFLTLSRESQRNTLEALIFASDEPLTMRTLYKVLIMEDGLYTEVDDAKNPANDTQPLDLIEADVTIVSDEAQAAPDTVKAEGAEEGAEAETPVAAPTKAAKKESLAKKRGLPELAELSTLILELADEINESLNTTERPYRVVRIAGGLQFATTSEFGEVVARLLKSRNKRRLSQAALEALAIIAYKQPISKPEIEAIRGINSNEVINSLVEKNLVTLAGRSDAPGKPLLYGTTDDFLRMFGLHSTKDLPKLRELDDLFQNKAQELASGLDISVKTTSSELLEKIQSLVDNEHKIEESHHQHDEAEKEAEAVSQNDQPELSPDEGSQEAQ